MRRVNAMRCGDERAKANTAAASDDTALHVAAAVVGPGGTAFLAPLYG